MKDMNTYDMKARYSQDALFFQVLAPSVASFPGFGNILRRCCRSIAFCKGNLGSCEHPNSWILGPEQSTFWVAVPKTCHPESLPKDFNAIPTQHLHQPLHTLCHHQDWWTWLLQQKCVAWRHNNKIKRQLLAAKPLDLHTDGTVGSPSGIAWDLLLVPLFMWTKLEHSVARRATRSGSPKMMRAMQVLR